MKRRILLGAFPDGGYGLRVSKPGWDVEMNPVNNAGMMFNSDWASCLPVHWRSGQFIIYTGQTLVLSYADLGYTPFCAALYTNGSLLQPLNTGYGLSHLSSTEPALAVQALSNYVFVASNSLNPATRLSIVVFKVRAF